MRKKKAVFICFTGIDGAGKSTLSKGLVSTMKEKGITCNYVYGRIQPLLSRVAMWAGRTFLLRTNEPEKGYSEYSTIKKALFQNRFLSAVWECIFLSEHLLQIMFKVKFPLMMGRNIVCDRYVYDTVITDLAIDLSYPPEKTKRVLRRCLSIVPKPDIAFLVDVPEETAYHRKDDIPSIDYLKERRMIYLEVGQAYGMTILDGSKELPQLKSEVESKVFSE